MSTLVWTFLFCCALTGGLLWWSWVNDMKSDEATARERREVEERYKALKKRGYYGSF